MRILVDTEIADITVDNNGTSLRDLLIKKGAEIVEISSIASDAILSSKAFRVNSASAHKVDALLKGIQQEIKRRKVDDAP